jgi:hypothetical protein
MMIGVAVLANGGWLLAAESAAVFQTVDRGRSWTRADRGLPRDSRVNAFGAIGSVIVAGTDSGIFVSRDVRGSWQLAASGRVLSFATLGTRIYAGTDRRGILVSADQGASWTASSGFPAQKVRSLLADGERLYAGTDADGVWVTSADRWLPMREGLPPHAQIFALSTVQGRLFAGLYGRGLYAWTGSGWSQAGPVRPLVLASSGETLVAGHNPGGTLWSGDGGTTWARSVGLPGTAPVWEMGSGSGWVLAGVADGIYYSEDRGNRWTRASAGLPLSSPGVSFLIRGDFALAGALLK